MTAAQKIAEDDDDERIALIDLDGTVAGFDERMEEKMLAIASPLEGDVRPLLLHQKSEPPYIRERRRLIKSQPGFWRELPRLEQGFVLYAALKQLGFTIFVLTNGPKEPAAAWQEKREWCDLHLPDVPVIIGRDKGLVYGRVLVDDWPEYIERWLKRRPRGLVVMPARRHNEGFSHPSVVRFDGSNYAEVVARMDAQRTRKPEARWAT